MNISNSFEKYRWAWIGLALVVLGIAVLCYNRYQTQEVREGRYEKKAALLEEKPVAEENKAPSGAIKAPVRVKKPVPPASARYQSAVAIYGERGTGYRFQFAECSGVPGELTMKKGVRYMLDNRDDQEHTFRVGPNAVNIPAWDIAILTAGPVGQWYVTCDGGGAAVIKVTS